MSTKEEIQAAARKRAKSKEIDLGDGVRVSVRELTPAERKALNDRLWERGEDGQFLIVDKDGKLAADGGYWKAKPGVNITREWLLATLTPAEAVDGLLADDVPDSLKTELFEACQAINGVESKDVIVKNS